MKKILLIFTSVLLMSLAAPVAADAQCAMCKAVTKSNLDGGKNNVGKGINQGVLYLMSVPYILAGIGVLIWYRHRDKKKPEVV